MRFLVTAGLLAGLLAGSANAATFTYNDFSDVSTLQLNGVAAQAGINLRVVADIDPLDAPFGTAGSAYRTTAVPFTALTMFSTVFEFNVAHSAIHPEHDPLDGFTFVLQSNGDTALGGAGQDQGYVGVPNSVGVFLRGRDPAFVAVITNGTDPLAALPTLPPGSTPHTEGDFYFQNEWAWIDYDPISMTMNVYLSNTSTKPLLPDLSNTVDVFGALGGSPAFLGFSSGTGGASADVDIINWSFASAEAPEPATYGIFGLGLAALVLIRRRSQRQ